jgi:hypothetical protein
MKLKDRVQARYIQLCGSLWPCTCICPQQICYWRSILLMGFPFEKLFGCFFIYIIGF